MNKTKVAAATAKKLPDSQYSTADISDELYREIDFPGLERAYRINAPKLLIIRRGGSTHRVIDSLGIVHCYAAPETGKTVIRWKPRDPANPIQF